MVPWTLNAVFQCSVDLNGTLSSVFAILFLILLCNLSAERKDNVKGTISSVLRILY
jgi:hypothetical protein